MLVLGFSAIAEDFQVKSVIEDISAEMGTVEVNRWGTCAGYKWSIEWVTSPGNKHDLEVRNK